MDAEFVSCDGCCDFFVIIYTPLKAYGTIVAPLMLPKWERVMQELGTDS